MYVVRANRHPQVRGSGGRGIVDPMQEELAKIVVAIWLILAGMVLGAALMSL